MGSGMRSRAHEQQQKGSSSIHRLQLARLLARY